MYKRQVQKTLQVAGDQDSHGRRSRLVEGAAGIIGSGLDEVGQDVILVGSAKPVSYTHLDVYKRQALPRKASSK